MVTTEGGLDDLLLSPPDLPLMWPGPWVRCSPVPAPPMLVMHLEHDSPILLKEPCEGPAAKSGLRNPPIENGFIGLSCRELANADSTIASQRNKAIAGWKKSSVAWGVGV